MPQYPFKHEYRRSDTPLTLHPGMSLLKSSEGLGWKTVYAEVTDEMPHQATYRRTRDMWFVVPLRPLKIELHNNFRRQHGLLRPDSMVVTGPKEILQVDLANTTRVLHVFIRAEVFEEVANSPVYAGERVRLPLISMFGLQDRGLSLMLRSIKQAMDHSGSVAAMKTEYLARAIAFHTLELRDAWRGQVGSARRMQAFDPVIAHLRANLSAPLRVEELAAIAGLGRSAFIRQFRATLGQTPHQYVILERVTKACELLRNETSTLSDIAHACGFSDHAHMCASFKSLMGITPSSYRDERG